MGIQDGFQGSAGSAVVIGDQPPACIGPIHTAAWPGQDVQSPGRDCLFSCLSGSSYSVSSENTFDSLYDELPGKKRRGSEDGLGLSSFLCLFPLRKYMRKQKEKGLPAGDLWRDWPVRILTLFLSANIMLHQCHYSYEHDTI